MVLFIPHRCFLPHITNEEKEAQKGKENFLRSKHFVEAGFDPRHLLFQIWTEVQLSSTPSRKPFSLSV